jgi:hypothetical protein
MSSSSFFKTRLIKIVRWGIPALCTAVAVLISVTVGWRPVFGAKSRPLMNRQFERTPERLARGKYLVEGVLGCFDCHSQLASDKVTPGTVPQFSKPGSGRVVIDDGDLRVAAPNITPDLETGAGTWSDDQFARAIREGIGHDGRTLFPMMPYQYFRGLSDEDLAAAIVFIRSLPPVRNQLPPRKIPFPLSRLINSAPQPLQAPVAANVSDAVSRGRYLATIGGCPDCHTPKDKMGRPLPGMDFAGGMVFAEFGDVTSANITPDPSGISYYDEAMFMKTIRTGHAGARPLHFPMPWWIYRNMTDNDLKSLFAFLRTIPPVHHRVDNSEPIAQCTRCNHPHPGGSSDSGE